MAFALLFFTDRDQSDDGYLSAQIETDHADWPSVEEEQEGCVPLSAIVRTIIARAHSDAEVDYLKKLGANLVIMGEREIADFGHSY